MGSQRSSAFWPRLLYRVTGVLLLGAAVVSGLEAQRLGWDARHKQMVIGALVGGLAFLLRSWWPRPSGSVNSEPPVHE